MYPARYHKPGSGAALQDGLLLGIGRFLDLVPGWFAAGHGYAMHGYAMHRLLGSSFQI